MRDFTIQPTFYDRLQSLFFSSSFALRAASVGLLLLMGGVASALFIGIFGPLIALALAVATVAGVLILLDTHWGFVALLGVVFVLPFGALPIDIGFKPTFLDAALGALFFVWLFKLVLGRERAFIASPIGLLVALFMLMAVFSFANGLTHSTITSYYLRRFAEILLGIALFFVVINTVRTQAELNWVTRWLMLGGWACAAIAVIFYIIPPEATVWVLDRLARFDYPGGLGALRYIEDDPDGTMRAIGTAIDPNALGGMLILVGGLLAPQLVTPRPLLPRWVIALAFASAVVAIYLTFSRSALLGLAASIGLLALLKYRALIPLGIVGVLMIFVLPPLQGYEDRLLAGFAGDDLATQMRFGEYRDALTLVRRYPLFGVGFIGTPDIDLYLGVSMLYLIIASNMGLVGLAFFVAVIIGFYIMVARAWRQDLDTGLEAILLGTSGAVLGALVSGIFDHYWFNLVYTHMTVLFWLYLGLAAATVLISEGKE